MIEHTETKKSCFTESSNDYIANLNGAGQASGDAGVRGHEREREWAHRVGDVEAVTTSIRAQQERDGGIVIVLAYPCTVADSVVHGVVYRARASQ
jgi:hypothetical protein